MLVSSRAVFTNIMVHKHSLNTHMLGFKWAIAKFIKRKEIPHQQIAKVGNLFL